MTRDEAIALARTTAEARGWTWHGEVRATLHKKARVLPWLFGSSSWWDIRSNAGARGCNVRVCIDDDSGEVTSAGFLPR